MQLVVHPSTSDKDSLSPIAGKEDIKFAENMNRHNESPSGKAGKNKNESKQGNSKAAEAKARGEAHCSVTDRHQTQPEHEIHIWTERERRKKMRNMFSNLHSLLPHLPPKADKSTIVDEAIRYIRSLQLSLLQTQKLDKKVQAAASANLEFESNIVGGAAIFNQNQHPLMSTKDQSVNLEGIGLEPWTSQPTLCPVSAIEHCHFQTWASPNVVLSVCGEDAHIAVICMPPKQGLLSAIFYILEKHKLDVVTAHISSHNCRSMYMIHAHVNGGEYLESAPNCEEAFKSAIGELMFYL